MDLEKIYIKIKHLQKEIVKKYLDSIKELKPDAIQSALRVEDLGEDLIISFQVDKNDYDFIIGKLEDKSIRVIDIKEKLNSIKSESQKILKYKTHSNIDKTSISNQNKSSSTELNKYDGLAVKGEYKELYRISKNIALGYNVQQAAKARFRQAVENAIEIAYQKGLKSRTDFIYNLKKLLDIATDKLLKANNLVAELRTAGVCAIDLCTYNKDNFDELIKIANNSQLLNVINLKAVVKFSDLVMHDKNLFKDDIDTAVKKLNTRWLYNAHLSSAKDLTPGELGKYERFINFIIHTRKAEADEEYV